VVKSADVREVPVKQEATVGILLIVASIVVSPAAVVSAGLQALHVLDKTVVHVDDEAHDMTPLIL
jgi:hypothetical protein